MSRDSRWAARDKARMAERVAQHRCTQCGEKLPQQYTLRTCQGCLNWQRNYNRMYRAKMKTDPKHDDPVTSLVDTTPGCAICGLRGEHICLRGNATERKAWL